MAEGTAVAPTSASPAASAPVVVKEAAPKPGTVAPEQKKPENPFKGTKHVVSLDGATEEVSYEELLAGYQKDKTSQKRFKDAQAMQSATQELIKGLGSGDDKAWGWLKANVPKDVFKKVAFDFAYQEMEHDALPPEEKRKLELDQREKSLKEQEDSREQAEKQKAWQAEVQTAGQNIQAQIDAFVEKTGQKPTTEHLYRMSEYMLAYMQKHNELPPVEKLYAYTERQLEIDAESVLKKKSSDIQSLLKWMPPDVVKALKNAFINESESLQPRRASTHAGDQPMRKGEPKKMGIDEMFNTLEKRIKRSR